MTSRGSGLVRAALLALGLLSTAVDGASAQAAAPPRERVILFVDREGDPWYERVRAHDGVVRIERLSPLPGAELAAKDGRAAGRALGVTFRIERRTLKPGEPVGETLMAAAGQGVRAAVLDLPGDDLKAAAAAHAAMALFNVRDEDDSLRAETCRGALFHVIPARSMRTDALAQLLVRRNWKKILVLEGPEPADKAVSVAMQASAKKFGARVAGVRPFAITNDPRRREETNLGLLTSAEDYDVVFVADSIGDYGRMVPYRTILPRPVVGTEGLRPLAWHPAAERNGAPQLNRRFEREAGRRMGAEDWAAWAAVRATIDAETRSAGDASPTALVDRLLRGDTSLELYKAFPGSFRPWDRQLRQGIFLATHNAVIELAPIEGFLHETNTLDTLGAAPSQSPCGR